MDDLLLMPNGRDYFEVVESSPISNIDVEIITRLYQPIIGFKGAVLFFTLHDFCIRKNTDYIDHSTIFNHMQITPSEFLYARRTLEGVSLLRTFKKEENGIVKYLYELHNPKDPKSFFEDVLLKGMLVSNLGEKKTFELANTYLFNPNISKLDKNISAKFKDVFSPVLDGDMFKVNVNINLQNKKILKDNRDFDYDVFFSHLKLTTGIVKDAFSNEELDEIINISLLYGLDMITVCDLTSQCFNAENIKGKKVDLKLFLERAVNEAKYSSIIRKNKQKGVYIKSSGKTIIADELKQMELLAPKDYLQIKQNGAATVSPDLKLLYFLSNDMHLSRGVINALINYCLKQCDNRLNRNYIEKIAGALSRESITSALDAMNYLENCNSKTKKSKINTQLKKKNEDDDLDLDEYNSILESVTKKK